MELIHGSLHAFEVVNWQSIFPFILSIPPTFSLHVDYTKHTFLLSLLDISILRGKNVYFLYFILTINISFMTSEIHSHYLLNADRIKFSLLYNNS